MSARAFGLVERSRDLGWQVDRPKGGMFAWAPIPEPFSSLGSVEFSKLLVEKAEIAVIERFLPQQMDEAAVEAAVKTIRNYVGGKWIPAQAKEYVDVHNPAVGSVIARTPLSTRADLDAAVQAAAKAFPAWRDTPVVQRARAMIRFTHLLEQHFEELARTVTTEHGKTLDEARGSVRRGIECVELLVKGRQDVHCLAALEAMDLSGIDAILMEHGIQFLHPANYRLLVVR
jgi:hypothetical protein